VAVAGGAAFTFGYTEQAELLRAAGAQVAPFDPLRDEDLPEGTAGLILGGGFPEVHAADLSANTALRARVVALASAGAPIAAECAGLLYLARTLDGVPMCGALDLDAAMTDRLTLGYRDALATTDSPIAASGTRIHGHEFHRTAIRSPHPPANAWQWAARGTTVTEGFVQGGVHASYLHTHWAGHPDTPHRLVSAAERHRARRP